MTLNMSRDVGRSLIRRVQNCVDVRNEYCQGGIAT